MPFIVISPKVPLKFNDLTLEIESLNVNSPVIWSKDKPEEGHLMNRAALNELGIIYESK